MTQQLVECIANYSDARRPEVVKAIVASITAEEFGHVELVANTPGAIGYSGMGYATDKVVMLKVAKKAGDPAVAPTEATTIDKSYPIARSLLMYTLGAPEGETKAYIDWIQSDAGQKIVKQTGYVPLRPLTGTP